MTEVINAIILAIIQGLTEFLPVSSSGHLVFFELVFNFKFQDNTLMIVVLHFGTMLATVVVFKKEVFDIIKTVFSKKMLQVRNLNDFKQDDSLWLILIIIIGTIPTGIIALLFKDTFEQVLGQNLLYVAIAFLITGTILFSTKFIKLGHKKEYTKITFIDTLIIGFVQGLAITPGISRSGITISTGLWLGISREKMGRYSFLLSLPAIFGATLLKAMELNWTYLEWIPLVVGFVASFFSGYFALKIFVKFLDQGKLFHFTYYCWCIGLVSLFLSFYLGI